MHHNCRHCHVCGSPLEKCLDGEEWCPVCQAYRRYKSHGWGWKGDGDWECPQLPAPLAIAAQPTQAGVL